MAQFRNFKMVDYVVYGRGSFIQLEEILHPHRERQIHQKFHFWLHDLDSSGLPTMAQLT